MVKSLFGGRIYFSCPHTEILWGVVGMKYGQAYTRTEKMCHAPHAPHAPQEFVVLVCLPLRGLQKNKKNKRKQEKKLFSHACFLLFFLVFSCFSKAAAGVKETINI
ncbi:MAG: hypothetical protein IJ901_00545 [Bacteroidaceae bacterium]|nr:hypothetical protein [Bacteroidaceae bacterium]